ncbi:putative polyamine transporter [Pseudozyma hubeiensis SY62]|uniref:Putative polyamine transporter n=1 Tax=Pseudozyma hubeiensis (strain SY62) TaxID=1305764 RepID=R9P0B3_PSEHS|nr:putative polyamine transporter [Pseudozyma hubeiensis SY62]GAC94452.1 putative polyamine transporter [Pseudozyma hubeiensis SY62]
MAFHDITRQDTMPTTAAGMLSPSLNSLDSFQSLRESNRNRNLTSSETLKHYEDIKASSSTGLRKGTSQKRRFFDSCSPLPRLGSSQGCDFLQQRQSDEP